MYCEQVQTACATASTILEPGAHDSPASSMAASRGSSVEMPSMGTPIVLAYHDMLSSRTLQWSRGFFAATPCHSRLLRCALTGVHESHKPRYDGVRLPTVRLYVFTFHVRGGNAGSSAYGNILKHSPTGNRQPSNNRVTFTYHDPTRSPSVAFRSPYFRVPVGIHRGRECSLRSHASAVALVPSPMFEQCHRA